MRIVIQRVKQASVTVDSKVISSIGRGLMVLVGISNSDTPKDVERLAAKLVGLRLFDTPCESETVGKHLGKPWTKSVAQDPELSILSVSQFTLYGTIKKGTKPDFHKAAKGEVARELYDKFLSCLRQALSEDRVKDGSFGAMMDVLLVNDGPVTIIWDTNDQTM